MTKAEFRDGWWHCTECGAELPEAPKTRDGRGFVECSGCGAYWLYDYWTLNRWPGDTGTGGLTPRLMDRGRARST